MQGREQNLRLFINHTELKPSRHWLKLRPVGRGKDRNAIGLQVDVKVGERSLWRHVESGSAYKSQSSLVLHVGLGTIPTAESIVARWPNGGGSRTLVSYPGNRTWWLYPDERLGDLLGDGVLGWEDLEGLMLHLDGGFSPGAELFDFDGDADVDGADRIAFLGRFCDLSGDFAVGAVDLAELLGRWGKRASSPAEGDFDADGTIGAGDLAMLIEGWSG